MRPIPTWSVCSASGCLANPWVIQGLPVESEGGLALRGVVVQGHDEDPMDDGPKGTQDEPVEDRADGPDEIVGAVCDSPGERQEAEREEDEEHEAGPQDALLVRAPPVLQEGAAAAGRLQGTDSFDDHRRQDEQGRDRPYG